MNREVCAMVGVVCLLGAALADVPQWLAVALGVIAVVSFATVRWLWNLHPS